MGYHRAGFEVVGVDIDPQPNYPFRFHQADALNILAHVLRYGDFLGPLDAIHASPPCQGYSTVTPTDARDNYPLLIEPVRDLLVATGLPYVIENVEAAAKHMIDPVRVCGSAFHLDIRRHRYFETNWGLAGTRCRHQWQTPRFRSLDNKRAKAGKLASVVGVHGHINYAGEWELRQRAMGINWMTPHELAESIPPAYTEFIGWQLREAVACQAA